MSNQCRKGGPCSAGWRNFWVPLMLGVAAAGCSHTSSIKPSAGHIRNDQQAPEKPAEIPKPVKVAPFVPPPKPVEKPQLYSVVVNEVPVKEVLFALARDSKRNVDIHPSIQGSVTLNAINETLPAILDRVANQVNLRYKIEADTLVVTPDSPYLKSYQVNYVNIARNTASSIGVATQIATTGSSGVGATGTSGQGADSGNSSRTTVQSKSNNNFWEVLEENIRSIIVSTRAASMSAEDKAARADAVRTTREQRLQQVEAVARAGAGAPNLFTTAFGTPAQTPADEARQSVIVNPVAGTVTVLATERQHALIQQYLDGVLSAAQRQVLIEATIVEVVLSDNYKAGVDWSALARGVGFSFNQQLLNGNLGTSNPPNLTIGYSNSTSSVGNLAATLSLLQSFGNIRVLSSPKLMALNNQTALLKVVNNVVYFSIDVQPGTTTGSTVTAATYSTTAHTVPVGVVMSVTPQVNTNGMVSLTVRPTISRVVGFKNDPNPALGSGASRINNPVPEVQVREMESVLQVLSGQTVILGGLMQDDISNSRDGIPGLMKLPDVGDAFSYRDEATTKTELVIFLRPTTISNPSLESDELKFFRRYLPQADESGSPATTAAKP